MRLECPECHARYEVDDSAIPARGRTVQCGTCNTTWYQQRIPDELETASASAERMAPALSKVRGLTTAPVEAPRAAPVEPRPYAETPPPPPPAADESPTMPPPVPPMPREMRAEAVPPGFRTVYSRTPEPMARPEPDRPAEAAPVSEPEPPEPPASGEEVAVPEPTRIAPAAQWSAPAPAGTATTPERDRELDAAAAVAEVLARRNRAVRANVRPVADMPEPEAVTPPLPPGATVAIKPEPEPAWSDSDGSIDLIEEEEDQARSGFARGMVLALVLFVVLLAVYALHERIAAAVPEAGPYLDAYVGFIDRTRLRLEGAWSQVVTFIQIRVLGGS